MVDSEHGSGRPQADACLASPSLAAEPATPSCRVCGKSEWVGCYDEAHPERTVCAECCPTAEHHDGETGHQFDYERGEGWLCRYCCTNRTNTDFDYGWDGDDV